MHASLSHHTSNSCVPSTASWIPKNLHHPEHSREVSINAYQQRSIPPSNLIQLHHTPISHPISSNTPICVALPTSSLTPSPQFPSTRAFPTFPWFLGSPYGCLRPYLCFFSQSRWLSYDKPRYDMSAVNPPLSPFPPTANL